MKKNKEEKRASDRKHWWCNENTNSSTSILKNIYKLNVKLQCRTKRKSAQVTVEHWWCNVKAKFPPPSSNTEEKFASDGQALSNKEEKFASDGQALMMQWRICGWPRCVTVGYGAGQCGNLQQMCAGKKCCWSKCRYKDTNIFPDTKMHNCKDMCRYNSTGRSMGTKKQIYIFRYKDVKYEDMCRICTADTKVQRCVQVQKYKDVCSYKRGHCRTDQLFPSLLLNTSNKKSRWKTIIMEWLSCGRPRSVTVRYKVSSW